MLIKKIYLVYESLSLDKIKEFELLANSGFKGFGRSFFTLLKSLKELKKRGFFDNSDEKSTEFLLKKTKLKKSTLLSRLSELYKIAEYYLIIESADNSKQTKQLILLDLFLTNKNYKLYNHLFSVAEKEINESPNDMQKAKNLFDLHHLAAKKSFYTGDEINYISNFLSMLDYSALNFLTEMLKARIELNQQKRIGRSYDTIIYNILDSLNLDDIIEALKLRNKNIYQLIKLLKNLDLMFGDLNNKKYYLIVRNSHKKYKNLFAKDWNFYFYSILINYGIQQTNLKRYEFYTELFNIISEKLEEGHFEELKESNYPVNQFRDYVLIALRLKEIKWAREFVSEYSKYLPENTRTDEINISKGMIYIEEENYEDAMISFKKVKKTNYIHYIGASINIARCCLRLKHYEHGFEEILRLKSYLKYHNDVPREHIDNANYISEDIMQLLKYYSGSISKQDLNFYFSKQVNRVHRKWISDEINIINK